MAQTTTKYIPTIGLEIHVQLNTKTKMFCRCDNNSETAEPNTNVCPICMGYPGVLPVMNEQAIEWGIKTALALGCQINPMQRFDRKNYFYPDLPKGYQISQFFYPVGEHGQVEIDYLLPDRKSKAEFKVGITRLHLEEDAGKLVHVADASLVDLNRCGTPLMEIVTEPDINSPEEAKAFMQELQRVVRSLGVSLADMEKGHLRVDANVSVRPEGQAEFGAKVEVKNMNSFKFMEKALKFEIDRQIAVLEEGGKLVQETRGWDEKTNSTVSQRIKEGSVDYRYFPEPDLPPITVTAERVSELREQITNRLPHLLRADALVFGLSYDRVSELQDIGRLDEFVGLLRNIKDDEDFAKIDVTKFANLIAKGKDFKNSRTVKDFMLVVAERNLSATAVDKLYEAVTKSPDSSIETLAAGLEVADESTVQQAIETVLAEHLDEVTRYKAGDQKVFGFLMGQALSKAGGGAEPALVKDILQKLLTK